MEGLARRLVVEFKTTQQLLRSAENGNVEQGAEAERLLNFWDDMGIVFRIFGQIRCVGSHHPTGNAATWIKLVVNREQCPLPVVFGEHHPAICQQARRTACRAGQLQCG